MDWGQKYSTLVSTWMEQFIQWGSERQRKKERVRGLGGWIRPSGLWESSLFLPIPTTALPPPISHSLPSSTFPPLFKIPWVDNVFPGSPTASQCPWLSGDQTLRSIGPLLAALARCLSLAPSALRYVNILCDGEGEKKRKKKTTSAHFHIKAARDASHHKESGMLIVV